MIPTPKNVVILPMMFRHNMFDMLRKLGHELVSISYPYRCRRCDCFFEEQQLNPGVYLNYPNEPLVYVWKTLNAAKTIWFYNLNSEHDPSYARDRENNCDVYGCNLHSRSPDRDFASIPYPEHYCTRLRSLL